MKLRYAVLALVCFVGVAHTGAAAPRVAAAVDSVAPERIVVVGGGISGLAAAHTLHEAGYEVVVLEAKDHLGGRVWTDRATGTPLDMGANWIQGVQGNPISTLADQLGLERVVTDYDNTADYDFDGTPEPLNEAQYASWESVLWSYTRSFLRRAPNATIQIMIDRARQAGELDTLTDRQLDFLLNNYVEQEYAADAAEMAVRGLGEGKSFRGDDVVFPGGYDAIIAALASGLSVHLSTVVRIIEHGGFGVRVHTDSEVFEAQRLVVTLPLGVLKSGDVKFTPRLPLWKRRAIERLEMGVLNKVWLVFPNVFWDAEVHAINYLSQGKGRFSYWLNLSRHTGAPVLVAFNAGAYGREVETLSDAQIIDAAMQVLRRIYGGGIPDPVATRITRWSSDPFAYGSYSFLPPGARSVHRRRLARAVKGRLLFAGEATSHEYPATVHGAYLSGVRAAEQILDR